jgi:lipid II:glycine glycyltransferase (peptidoglycan interpeptide bridge formation enzyme)
MNANEMANKLSQYGEGAVFANIKLTDVANMLRKQQEEIEYWKEMFERSMKTQEHQNEIAILEQQRDAYKESHEALLAHNLQKGKLES